MGTDGLGGGKFAHAEALAAHIASFWPATAAGAQGQRFAVLTGGEPCLYDLHELSSALLAAGYQVQIETSGTSEILTHAQTWVTVSPKIGMKGGLPVLVSALERANEIKHPVATERHIEELDALLATASLRPNSAGRGAVARVIFPTWKPPPPPPPLPDDFSELYRQSPPLGT